MIGIHLPDVILASASPRRTQLLQQIGIEHEVLSSSVVEKRLEHEKPRDYALRNARAKCHDVFTKTVAAGERLIVSADTIVVLRDQVLEKPLDTEDARRMLQSLSGRTHLVVSAVCLMHAVREQPKVLVDFDVITEVEFFELTPDQIDGYVRTGEPLDKAGAYGAQGIGAMFVKQIKGSYHNVVGLPIGEMVQHLMGMFSTARAQQA